MLAARRAGITTVILPRQNAKTLVEDVPAEVRAGLTVHLVSTVAEGLRLALREAAWPRPGHTREPLFAGHSAN